MKNSLKNKSPKNTGWLSCGDSVELQTTEDNFTYEVHHSGERFEEGLQQAEKAPEPVDELLNMIFEHLKQNVQNIDCDNNSLNATYKKHALRNIDMLQRHLKTNYRMSPVYQRICPSIKTLTIKN